MFCLKCGSHLPDDAKFCGVCGAPVNTVQENAPVMQQPAGTANEAENTQMPNAAPFMEAPQFNGQIGCGVAAPVQKKSKKGLIIGLSIGGGVLLAVVVAIALIFVFGEKNDSNAPVFVNAFAHDSKYTYYLDGGDWSENNLHHIMRIGNNLEGEPQILHSFYSPWSGNLFLWDDKICYGDDSALRWFDMKSGQSGTIATTEQLVKQAESQIDGWDDAELSCPARWKNVHCDGDSLVFYSSPKSSYYSYQLDLRTGILTVKDGIIERDNERFYLIANLKGNSYYVNEDPRGEVNALYRKNGDSELEKVADLMDSSIEWNFVIKGDCVYFQGFSRDSYRRYYRYNFYRINTKRGNVEILSSYLDERISSFALSDKGLYYCTSIDARQLHYVDLETLAETVYDVPNVQDDSGFDFMFGTLFAGPDNCCIFARQINDWLGPVMNDSCFCFRPDKQDGSYIRFGRND